MLEAMVVCVRESITNAMLLEVGIAIFSKLKSASKFQQYTEQLNKYKCCLPIVFQLMPRDIWAITT